MEDRRSQERCPVCQGPARTESSGKVICRRSTGVHNHEHIRCPRCDAATLESVSYEKGVFIYTCAECTRIFSLKA